MSNSRNVQQNGHRSWSVKATNMLSKCFRRFLNVVGPVLTIQYSIYNGDPVAGLAKNIQYSIYNGDHVAGPAKNIELDSVFIHLIS